MITMLAHFSCLINIFFLSLSTLILSYFFFYWFAGCNYASACIWQQHEAAQRQLVEGKVYALFDFTVCPREHEYMACRNGSMIYMDGQTVVDEIDNNIGSSIPLHSFEFVDFDDVPSRNGDKRFFTGTWLGLGELLV